MKSLSSLLEEKYVNSVDELQQILEYGTGKIKNPVKPDADEFLDGHIDVHYADMDKISNIFEHIILFTNDRDPQNNKTLKNIYEAIDELKDAECDIVPELHIFVAENTTSKNDDGIITITDGEEKMIVDEKIHNYNTLVFSRLGVQNELQCEQTVKILQDRGFLILNPVQASAVACNKYETAVLLANAGIPQPNFTLMTRSILYDEKKFNTAMREVYPDWDVKEKDNNEEKELVIKILDGHGGTGVFLENGKRFYAVLQAIFAINPEQQLIIQKKEEADGGDIRAHVLTLNDRQVILAAMKRVKLSGDFRSNVSLGAKAKKVKLTKEQEQIALKVAKLSKMPWCAVDIMPLVKDSNPEIGDNVVLEMNASPGTDGITEVIKHNFIIVLLNELSKAKEFPLQDKTAGYMETVDITWKQNMKKQYLAKLDTGNGTKASCIEVGDLEYNEEAQQVTFTVEGKKMTYDVVDVSHAVTGSGSAHGVVERPIIMLPEVRVGYRIARDVPMSVVKSRDKSTNVLLNRHLLASLGYVVTSREKHLLTKKMEKLIIV